MGSVWARGERIEEEPIGLETMYVEVGLKGLPSRENQQKGKSNFTIIQIVVDDNALDRMTEMMKKMEALTSEEKKKLS